jgi:5-methylcytosine-specific restriction endonuclease McrA
MKTCSACGNKFTQNHGHEKYCSSVCRARARTEYRKTHYDAKVSAERWQKWYWIGNGKRTNKSRRNKRRSLSHDNKPAEVFEKALNCFGGECAYCGKPATCVDHLMPLSRGGDNEYENLIPSCRSCNSSKGPKLLSEWYIHKDFYDPSRESVIIRRALRGG